MCNTGGLRQEEFKEEWLEEQFGTEHQEAFGTKISRGGYPDMGDGKYTFAKGYKVWMEFNKKIRVHANWLENNGQICISMLCGGLYLPLTFFIWGSVYLLARFVFVALYSIAPPLRAKVAPLILFS